MPHLPVETLTFLFTDIEGSTKLWEAHPEAMRVALARHDALMREAIEANNGYIFKTVGDAFCAAFTTASDAVAAALDAQLALAQEVWSEPVSLRARMGLHTGAAEIRDNDYFGQALNRVARVRDVGHGGQVLLSDVAQDLCRDNLPRGASLQHLGEHRLKDLFRPESIFQLCHPSLPREFLPLRSLDNPVLRHNLPVQVTSFIGREKEVSQVKALLASTRLLTLTGSGGCGKTRLALQVAADLLDGSGDGVWLVELAPLSAQSDASLVAQTVAGVLGIKEEPGKPISQTLVEHLKSKHLLLVLDNCEHLVNACAELANALLRQCPQLHVLATSREGLGIGGETTYRVPSLSLPDPRQTQTPESLSHFESVRLFIERATQAQTTFAVTNQNAPALASICFRLDGIPLAIELAAARVRSLSVEEIEERHSQWFRLLTGGNRMALARQQTLRALIDWSYDLLNESEKALLCRLSVFTGGWTLEAAEQICSGDSIEDWEVLDLLTGLEDKSLVVAEQHDGRTRHRLLETVRQYAKEKLETSGEDEWWHERHLMHFLELAVEAEPQLKGPKQTQWIQRLALEHDNLRAAMVRCREVEGHGQTALRLTKSLWRFWYTRGYFSEGLAHYQAALTLDGAGGRTSDRAQALNGAGIMACNLSDYPLACSYWEESLATHRALGNKQGMAFALDSLGHAALELGDYDAARAFQEEALALAREAGDKWSLSVFLGNLAIVPLNQGDYETARTLNSEALALSHETGDTNNIATLLRFQADIVYRQGDLAKARSLLLGCLPLLQVLDNKQTLAYFLETFASIHFTEGQGTCAGKLWGAAEALREEISAPLSPVEVPHYKAVLSSARTAVGDVAFNSAWAEGRVLSLKQALALALEKPSVTA